MNEPVNPQLLDQIKTILRRDLKLGPAAVIADDMPFFGGDVDLDSLDMLLLVTSLEKQFGIKVPNEAVGREVFQNVSTLTAFVQQQRNGSAAATPPPAQDLDRYLAKLPHGPAFRFLTSLSEVRPGHSARGTWKLKGDEPFFAGHFPGNPIVPGVLIVEALAQLSGIAGPDLGATGGKLVNIDVKFEQPVAPPAEIELESTLTRTMGELQLFAVSAKSAGKPVASGTVALFRG